MHYRAQVLWLATLFITFPVGFSFAGADEDDAQPPSTSVTTDESPKDSPAETPTPEAQTMDDTSAQSSAPDREPAPVVASTNSPGPLKDPIFLPRELAAVLRLTKADVTDDVIVAYIKKSPFGYNLTPDQIVTLRQVGVSSRVLTALLEHRGRGAVMPRPAEPAGPAAYIPGPPPVPPEISYEDFFSALSSYGQWYNVPGLGWCWQPAVAASNPGWQPYVDNGYWMLSNNGWYWNSGYPWGWAPFHYGRWTHRQRTGWLWRPDTDWSPGWVCWRRGSDFCGWAPLPPEAAFSRDSGWSFDGRAVGKDSEFGLESGDFVYVPLSHFADPDWSNERLRGDRADLFRASSSDNNYSFASAGRVNNWGIRPQILQAAGVTSIPRIQLVDRRASPTGSPPPVQLTQNNSQPSASNPQLDANTGANSLADAQMGPGAPFSDPPVQYPTTMFDVGGTGGFGGGWDVGSGSGSGGGWGNDGAGSDYSGGWGSGRRHHRHDANVPPIHEPLPNSGSATPWLPVGGRVAQSGLPPYGVYGNSRNPVTPSSPWGTYLNDVPQPPRPTGPRSDWWPRLDLRPPNQQWAGPVDPAQARRYAGYRNLGLGQFGPGSLGYGTLGRGVLGGVRQEQTGSTPWLAAANNYSSRLGAAAYLPFGSQAVPGGNPWGTFGVPTGMGSAPPYGVPGVPIVPNNGLNPYLPFGQTLHPGGPVYGPVVPVPRMNSAMANAGFQYLPGAPTLPGAPILPAAPMLPQAPTLRAPPQLPSPPIWPSYGFLGRAPSAPSAFSAPSAPSFGFHGGGGGHMGGGGVHVGGGGGAALGGGGGGAGGGGGHH